MKKILASVAILSLITLSVVAQNQKVVLCSNYDKTTGVPTGVDENWSIKKESGSFVYIIYSQDKVISQTLTLQVDKKNTSGNFVSHSRQSFSIKPSDKKKWAMYDYKFTSDGDYRVSVLGKGNISLAKTFANIAYMEESKGEADTTITTNYYKNSLVAFGESVENAVLKGEATTFKLTDDKRSITCMISNDSAFKTKQITIYLYTGKDYKEKVYSENYTIGGLDWDWVKLPIDVTKVGKYVADFYNDNDVYINSGYFEVTK